MNKSINKSILKYFLLGLSSVSAGIVVFNLNPALARSESCKDVNVSMHQAQASDSSTQYSEEGIDRWLLNQRIVIISQDINDDLAQTIIGQLLYLDAQAPG
ncbi:MAG TPA: ATP-dependent Clp protease proteolytic subunit, partial [Allocoleopsis sp.]